MLKKEVARFLTDAQIEFKDFGGHPPDSVDYPDIGLQVAEAVASGDFDLGILVCFTGVGMSITANKVPGIRAALCADAGIARLSREHNDANVLVLSEKNTDPETALDIVRTWLSSDFHGVERYIRRVQQISAVERKYAGKGC